MRDRVAELKGAELHKLIVLESAMKVRGMLQERLMSCRWELQGLQSQFLFLKGQSNIHFLKGEATPLQRDFHTCFSFSIR